MKFYIGDKLLTEKLYVADDFFKRLRGLMFRKKLPATSGLLLKPCNGVHTFFMKFNLDILYLDKDLKPLEVFYDVSPGKMLPVRKDCSCVLEVSAGVLPPKEEVLNNKCFITD